MSTVKELLLAEATRRAAHDGAALSAAHFHFAADEMILAVLHERDQFMAAARPTWPQGGAER